MASSWKIQSEIVYPSGHNPFDNQYYGYRSTFLELPNGKNATYHGVLVGACVHIVAIEQDLTTYLVRQSRPNARANHGVNVPETLELPGGFKDEGLNEETAANTELREEVGKHAGCLKRIGVLYPSPGVSNETDTIFLGTDLSSALAAGPVEVTEQDLRIVAEPFGKIYDQMLNGSQPVAAQTLAAMALAAARI